jgi:hypothetical protein
MTYFRWKRVFSLVGGVGAVACGSSPGTGTAGELGQGTFEYECVNSGDAHCASRAEIDEFDARDLGETDGLPGAVAVGSIFGLKYGGSVRKDGDQLLVRVEPAFADDEISPEIFSVSEPTEAAFVAVDSEGRAVDFSVMQVLEATELTLWNDQRLKSKISLAVGESLKIIVVPRSDSEVLLAGALPYLWTTTEVDVASFDSDREVLNKGEVEILAEAEGSAEVRVVSGDLGARLVVEVTP